MKKLSKSKAEVWDRLKNGIRPASEYDAEIETIIAAQLAKQMAEEIDKEIIKDLLNIYADSK